MDSPIVAPGLVTQPVRLGAAVAAAPTSGGVPLDPVVQPAVPSLQTPTVPQLQEAIQKVQAAMQPVASNIEFSLDQSTGRPIVKVVDSETGDIIRQIPSEEMMAIARAIDKVRGLMIPSQA